MTDHDYEPEWDADRYYNAKYGNTTTPASPAIPPFKVTSRVVAVSFPAGAPDFTGTDGVTVSPSFVRVETLHNRIEATGKKRKEDETLTAPLFSTFLSHDDAPEWLLGVLDLVLLGENQ